MPLTPDGVNSYRDIQDKYNELQQTHPELVSGMSMHDYASHLNEQTNSHNFDAGLNPNFVKDSSAAIDRGLDQTGITDLTGAIGRGIGSTINPATGGDIGEQYGRGFVRPLAAGVGGGIAGALIGGPGGAAAGAGEGLEAEGGGAIAAQLARAAWTKFGSNLGFGANQGLQTYTDTDSKTAAAASGTLGYLAQGFGEAGENIAAATIGRKVGSTLVNGVRSSVSGVLPTLAELATEKFGLTAGLAVNNEVTRQAVNVALGHGLTMPTTSDAVSDVAQAAAPLVLGLGHDVLGLNDANKPGRDVRSISESMNLVDAAQKIRTQEIQADVQKAAVAAQTTLDKTKQADVLRAGAVGQILNPDDAAKFNLMQHTTTPDEGTVVDNSQTVLGRPVRDFGVFDDPNANKPPEGTTPNVPMNKFISTNEEQPSQTVDNKPTTEAPPSQTPAGSEPVVPPGVNKGVRQQQQQPLPDRPLTPEVAQVVKQVPPPATLASVIDRASMLNKLSDVPKLDAFQQLVHMHTELLKQLADDPQLRDQLSITPITDKYLSDRVNHLMSKDGGSMKSLDALVSVYSTSKSHLKDKYLEFQHRQAEINEQLNTKNRATLAKSEADQAQAQAAAQQPAMGAKDFVLHAMDGPYGDEIERVLESHPDLPMNTTVGIERWVRQTRLNNDSGAREVLKSITKMQVDLGRRLKPEEVAAMVSGLDHEAADDVTNLHNRVGIMWSRDGTLSAKSRLGLLLKDDPKNPERGQWSMPLLRYLGRSAEREKAEAAGTVSLDKTHTDEGESTLAQTDLAGEIQSTARERHVDPVAQQTSAALADERLQQTKSIRDRIAQMGVGRPNQPDNEMARILQLSGKVVRDDLPRFKKLLMTWADAHSLLPEQRMVPERPDSKGGIDTWLMHGEQGTHTEWKTIGESNFPRWKKLCREFYETFTEVDRNGIPQIKEQYKDPDWYKPKPKPASSATTQKTDAHGYVETEESRNAVKVPPGTTVADSSATTYAKPTPEQTLAMSARGWFAAYLKESGVSEDSPMFRRYQDSMTRVAMLFPQIDKTRVGGIVKSVGGLAGDRIGGIAFNKYGLSDDNSAFSKLTRFVGLSYSKLSDTAASVFLQNMTAAHEFNHVIFRAKEAGELSPNLSAKMDAALEDVKNMSKDDRKAILDTLSGILLPKEIVEGTNQAAKDIRAQIASWVEYGANGGQSVRGDDPEEFLSTMFGMVGVGIANPAESTRFKSNMDALTKLTQFIPDRLAQFHRAYYTDLLHYTNALKGFFNEHTPGLGDRYFKIANLYKNLTSTPKEVDDAMASLHLMEALQPEQYVQLANDAKGPEMLAQGIFGPKPTVTLLGDLKNIYSIDVTHDDAVKASTMLQDARKFLVPDPKLAPVYGQKPGFFSLFTPLAQFAERFPVLRPMADTLLSFEGMVNSSNGLALSPFASRTVNGKLVKTENLDSLKRIVNTPGARNLLNAMYLWQNENFKLATAEDIAKYGPSVSPAVRADILSALTATKESMQTVGAGNINTSIHISGHMLGSLAMSMERNMTAKTGEQIGTNLMRALTGMRSQDPHTAEMAGELLGGVKMQLDPETWTHLLQIGQTFADKHAQLIDKITGRPFYTPETRPGQYGMYYKVGEKPYFESYKSETEAMAAHDAKAKQAGVSGLRLISPYKDHGPGMQYNDATVQHFVDLEQQAFQAARQVFADQPEKLAEFSKLYTPGSAIVEELGSRGIRKNLQERNLVGGRENIDMLSNSLNYITSMNRANARNFIRSKTLLQSQDPSLVNEDRLKKLFNDHMNNVLNPPAESLNWLKQGTTMYYIGGNFSSAAMQAFQPIQATLPHLTRNGVGIVQGMKYFAEACGTLFNAYGRGKGITGDPMLQAAFDKATANRVVGFQNVMSQFDHFDDAFVSRVKNFANDTGDSGMTPAKLLQNVSYQTTRVLSFMFQHVTEHNTRVGFIAGFNAARDQGKAKGLVGQDLADYAYSEAKRTVEESLHTGGPASRPVGFGQLKGGYGVVGNLYALNHFNFSMISIMARYGLEAIGQTGLEGAALHNARKAFGQALVTQLALGGAMGLPFAGAAVAMLEQLFPNLQLNRDMRTAISGLAGDDHELGGFLADASLKGLATAFSPVDVSGRLGLSAVLGEDPYYGFDAKDMLGASGSMFYNMLKGVQQVSQGNPEGAVNFLPNALQRMYKAASDGGAVRNSQGQVIFQPTDAQRVLMAIGLRPKDLSHAKEESMIDERNQTIQSRQLASWYQQQEAALSDGRFADVKSALYQKAQEDPTFSPIIALKRIAAGAQKSQVVQSPVDRGSAAELKSRESVGQTFGAPTTAQTQPSQVQQVLQRAELERQVGLPGAGQIAQTELSTARLTDYLMQKYNLDADQARVMIAQMHQGKSASFRQFHPGAVSPLQALGAGQQ